MNTSQMRGRLFGIEAVRGIAATMAPLHVPAWLRRLGGASYSIYLFQFIAIGAAWKLWLTLGFGQALPGGWSFPVLAGAAIAGGIAMTHLVERPILRLIRGGTPG